MLKETKSELFDLIGSKTLETDEKRTLMVRDNVLVYYHILQIVRGGKVSRLQN